MTATIWYETAEGVESIERDDYHTDTDPLLTAFNDPGATDLIKIPIQRIVRIHD